MSARRGSRRLPIEGVDVALLQGIRPLASIPAVVPHVIKVFLTSTATDMGLEKDSLINEVYIKLREYCRKEYGLEFQIIDLRWGCYGEIPCYNQDQTLGAEVLDECLHMSQGPNYVALLGQKYGHRALPFSVPAEDFEIMKQTLREHPSRITRDVDLLDVWYKCDTNSVPAKYVLIDPEYVPEHYRFFVSGERSWENISDELWLFFDRAVKLAIHDGHFDESAVETYLMSDIDKEIKQALRIRNTDDKQDRKVDKAAVFLRNIEDLKNYTKHTRAHEFMDIRYDEMAEELVVDDINKKHIEHLSQTQLPKSLGTDSISKFTILWRYDVLPGCHIYDAYMKQFITQFENVLKRKIDQLSRSHHVTSAELNVEEEVLAHWQQCVHICNSFVGRNYLLEFVRDYVISDSLRPLVLYGQTGVGKSAMQAKIASLIPHWLCDQRTWTIVRFIGHTSASQDVLQLLSSIYEQLQYLLTGSCTSIPADVSELATAVTNTMAMIPDDVTLVLILDGLDLLVPQHKAHGMSWLPATIRENVKIIVTTAPDMHGILDCLRHQIIRDESHIVEIGALSSDECKEMLMVWLEDEDRMLTEQQLSAYQQAFNLCGYPLFVKLVFEDAKHLHSFTDNTAIPTTIDTYLNVLLDRLELRHGTILTSHTLAYITASRTGLSDCEIEDILSLDDEVLDDVFDRSEVGIRRLPTLLWYRLRRDIWNLLAMKTQEGITTFYWTHRKFVEVCRLRYLQDKQRKVDTHKLLADYFLGLWSNKKKPYTVVSHGDKTKTVHKAKRHVISQPLTFGETNGNVNYNRRKYDQVPQHLYFAGRFQEFSDHIIFNYDWLYNKTKALSLDYVLHDFLLNPGVETSLVERALRDAHPYIREDKESLVTELTGRLLPYYNTNTDIRSLINQCDRNGVDHCGIVPTIAYHCVPGSPLKYTLTCPAKPESITLVGATSRYLLVKQASKTTLYPYDLVTGEYLPEIIASAGQVHHTPDGKHLVIIDNVTQKAVKIHAQENGKFLGQLIPMNHLQMKPKEKYSLAALSVCDSHVCLIVSTDISYLCIASISQCRFLHIQGIEGKANLCTITPDAQYVFTNSGRNITVYDLQNTYEKISTTKLDYCPKQLIFSNDSKRAFSINNHENKVYVLHLRNGDIEMVYKLVLNEAFPNDSINSIVLSTNQQYLLARGNLNLLVYNLQNEKIICHFPKPKDMPAEFKMPNSSYIDIYYTAAEFTADDKFVVASIFRNIYIWSVVDSRVLTTLQAPIGIIDTLLIPKDRGQIVSHLQGSQDVHVWSLGDSIAHVSMHDKMTKPIIEIMMTSDNQTAFVRCAESDEVGVINTSTGDLVDLLTHPGTVKSIAVTPDGQFAFVGTNAMHSNVVNKIWNVSQRKVIYEFGTQPCHGVALKQQNSILCIYRTAAMLSSPYCVKLLQLHHAGFDSYPLNTEMYYVTEKPFVTENDKFLIVLAAQGFDNKHVLPVDPTIYAVRVKSLTATPYRTSDLQKSVGMTRILTVKPHPSNAYAVIIIYTRESDLDDNGKMRQHGYDHCYGFLILDINSGVVCQLIDSFLTPTTPLNKILFNQDVSLCIDNLSNVFDMSKGFYEHTIQENTNDTPHCLILRGTIVVYYNESTLYARRIEDKELIGQINVHNDISAVTVANDDRTLMVGCVDGSFVGFVLIDKSCDNAVETIASIPSRQSEQSTRGSSSRASSISTWDMVDCEKGRPPYSRPPSAVINGPTDKELLQSVKTVSPDKPLSEALVYMGTRSAACCIQ